MNELKPTPTTPPLLPFAPLAATANETDGRFVQELTTAAGSPDKPDSDREAIGGEAADNEAIQEGKSGDTGADARKSSDGDGRETSREEPVGTDGGETIDVAHASAPTDRLIPEGEATPSAPDAEPVLELTPADEASAEGLSNHATAVGAETAPTELVKEASEQAAPGSPSAEAAAGEPTERVEQARAVTSELVDPVEETEISTVDPDEAIGAPSPSPRSGESEAPGSSPTNDSIAAATTIDAPSGNPSGAQDNTPQQETPQEGGEQNSPPPRVEESLSAAPTGVDADTRPPTESGSTAPSVTAVDAATEAPEPAERSVAAPAIEKSEAPTVDPSRFVSRVSRAFEAADQRGGGPIEIRLSPPELGSMQLKIEVKEGVLTASIETETQSARNALLDNLPALRERLAEQQIRVEKFDVDVRDESGSGAGGEQQAGREAGGRDSHATDDRAPTLNSNRPRTTDEEPTPTAPSITFGDDGINLVA